LGRSYWWNSAPHDERDHRNPDHQATDKDHSQARSFQVFRIGVHDSTKCRSGSRVQSSIVFRLSINGEGSGISEVPIEIGAYGVSNRASLRVLRLDSQDGSGHLEALLPTPFLESLPRQIHQADQAGSDGLVER
jgi:hypothetical protein